MLNDANYKYLEVKGTVKNKSTWELVLETVNLDWGKFDENKSPKGVPAGGEMQIVARGSDSRPRACYNRH